MNRKLRVKIVEVISMLFLLLFLYASVSKIIDFEKFSVQLGQSPILTAFSAWIAWIVPTTEIIICVMLLIPKFRLLGLYTSFTLMVMFTAYIIAITQFSEYVPCSCGGILQNMSCNQQLIFNIGFILLGLAGIFLDSKEISRTNIITTLSL